MFRNVAVAIASLSACVGLVGVFCGCDSLSAESLTGLVDWLEDGSAVEPDDDGGGGPEDGAETEPEEQVEQEEDDGESEEVDEPGVVAGVLQVKAMAESLGDAARMAPSGQDAPDDVDVNLTPTEYTIAFKRLVLRQVDEETEETLVEVEVFSADAVEDALVVDLLDTMASDVLDVGDLPAGTYNQVDIEVFYLDMTIPTLYPADESHDIAYRMVFEQMGVLEPRDFLLYLQPAWMEAGSELADSVVEEGWYWMEMSDPDHVEPVAGADAHPEFNVLDLFANEEFWSAEHKVLEGGRIDPPLEYDPDEGGVLTISFDVTGKFNFKDYHDETTDPDGQWEIRRDAGIHPFPPDFECVPGELASL